MVHPSHLGNRDKIIKLWCHESARVFRDRLIDENDRTWFNEAVQSNFIRIYRNIGQVDDFADLIYGDFMTREDKAYQELDDRDKVNQVLLEYLDEYNITFPSRMELVFFRDAINHVARIARVLSQPRGCALLVGVGGSGRQSLTRMASFMADMKCRQIEITRCYGMNEWHENLKEILIQAGGKNQPVFLFSDTQIVTETFLEDLNNILNGGEVPNLFEQDEMEAIVGMVRPLANKLANPRHVTVLCSLVSLVRENLHIVVCMPNWCRIPHRCRMFPSLVNCCTIDWFNVNEDDCTVSRRGCSRANRLWVLVTM